MNRLWRALFEVNRGWVCRHWPWVCPMGHLHTTAQLDRYMARHAPWIAYFLIFGIRDETIPHWIP